MGWRSCQGQCRLWQPSRMERTWGQVLGDNAFSNSCNQITPSAEAVPAFGHLLFPHPYDQRLKASQIACYSSRQKACNGKKSMWNCWSNWMQCHWELGGALLCTTGVGFGSVPSAHYGSLKPCGLPHSRHEVSSPVSLLGFVRYSRSTMKQLCFLLLWCGSLPPPSDENHSF